MRIKIPLIFAILVTVVSLGYANTFYSPFQFDDAKNIVNNHNIRDLYSFLKISSLRYRHITSLSFASNYYLGKLNPLGYHLFNLILHACATILVFLISLVTLEKGVGYGYAASVQTAFVTALCFALNPVFSEAITYVSGRASSLSAVFCLLSWYFFMLGSLRRTGVPLPRIFIFLISLISLFAAVLSKETAMTMPLALLLYDVCFIKNESWVGWKTRFVYFYAIIPLLAIIFILKSKASVSLLGWWLGQARFEYALAQVKVIVYAIKLFIFPVNLTIEYNSNYILDWSDLVFTLPVLFFVAIIFLAIKNMRTKPIFSFPILWMLITISPTNSFIPREDLLSERNLYLPFVGLALFVAIGFNSLRDAGNLIVQEKKNCKYYWWDSGSRCAVAILVLLTIYSTLLITRNYIYLTPLAFWEDTYEKAPNKLRVLHNLSLEYMRLNDREKTYATLIRMLMIDPFNYFARINLANIHMNNGETARAIREFEDLIKRNPDAFEPYFNLGSYYASVKNFQKAKEYYEFALKKYDGIEFKKIYYYLAKVCYEMGLLVEAESYATGYVGIDNAIEGNILLAQIFIDTGREYIAEKVYRVDMKKDAQEQAIAQSLLALLYVRQKKIDQAIIAFEKSISLNPKEYWTHVSLANLLVDENRDREKTLLHLKQALRLTRDLQQQEDIKKMISGLNKEEVLPEASQFEEALLREPESPEHYINMGEYYAGQGYFQKAKEYFAMAVEKNGIDKNLNLLFYQARAYLELGQFRESEFAVRNYLHKVNSNEWEPRAIDVEKYILLAEILIALERYGEVDSIISAFMNVGYLPQANYIKGLLNIKRQKSSEAIADFEESIRLNPKDFRPHKQLGKLLQDKPETALQHLNHALVLNSNPYQTKLIDNMISKMNTSQ